MTYTPYEIGKHSKKVAEELIPNIQSLGEVIGIGEHTIAIKPSFPTKRVSTLIISSEKEKLFFIKRLSKYYKNFFVEELNLMENRDCFLIPEMTSIILSDKEDLVTMKSLNKEFVMLSSFDFKALNRIKNSRVRTALKIALKAVENDNAYLDLHSLQFVLFKNELICIDPVYY